MNYLALLASLLMLNIAVSDDHSHHGPSTTPTERPKVFLDKSPRIVEYQLKRLDNSRLLLVERDTSDGKYIPVFRAILVRPGMSRRDREESLEALVTLRKSDPIIELLDALKSLNPGSREQKITGIQLSEILLSVPGEKLKAASDQLTEAAKADQSLVSAAGFAALLAAEETSRAEQIASMNDAARLAWLEALLLLPSNDLRSRLRPDVVKLLQQKSSDAMSKTAIRVLADIPAEQSATFEQLATFVDDVTLRATAVSALLKIPDNARSVAVSRQLVVSLVDAAEQTPVADRTADQFVDALQLIDQLLPKLMAAEATQYRQRLREVSVQLVRIRTIHEEMRYDLPYFVVEAGRSVQLIVQNDDLMPHNLVITNPGKLQNVAVAGGELGPNPGFQNLPFVPDSPDVLFATAMVESGRQERLTFTAPTAPGEYPYVCTFPRHWMRMYGVMVVVADPDAWHRNPVPPKDPLGNTRTFVKNWTLADFESDLTTSLQDPNADAGFRLFREATCIQCHRTGNEGGNVGPNLTDVLSRWKGDHKAVLREILDPSYRIDPRYSMMTVVTKEGRTVSGIVRSETDSSVSLLTNPEAKEPVEILRSEIDEIVPSSTSMMPKALLDKFTKDEIMEILKYVTRPETGSQQ